MPREKYRRSSRAAPGSGTRQAPAVDTDANREVAVSAPPPAPGESRIFKRVADEAAEGIAVIGTDMRLVYVNDAWCRLYGLGADELLGEDPLAFGLSDTESKELATEVDRAFREHDCWSGEITIRRPDGSRVPVLVSAAGLHDDSGGSLGRVATMTDLSAFKWAESRLREVNAALDSYARTVSHDLRGPLTSIVLANRMLRDAAYLDDAEERGREIEEWTSSIGRSISRAYSLIDGVLSLAESGQRPEEAVVVDVSRVVAMVLEERSDEIRARGVEVRCDGDLGRVVASETHLYQLFSNLLGNGFRHNDSPSPVLTLTHSSPCEGRHRYLMRDNGSGISRENMEAAFGPLRPGPPGSCKGLGLSIVKRIVDVYGGTFRIYNEGGACFEFELRDRARPIG